MNNKISFFCDEIYTYSLANSRNGTIFAPMGHKSSIDCSYKWLDGSFFKEYITVSKTNRFDFSNAYNNQISDSHPPLYYYFIHIICSLFPESFSKWYGFGLNIICFILVQILLYLVCIELFKDEKYALLCCLIYGFSAGAIDCYIFIRMYSLLTFFYLLLLYIYIKCFDNKCSVGKALSIITTITLGGLTQYHFWGYAFILTLLFVLFCLYKKYYKMFALVSITAISGVIIANVYFPYLLTHIHNSPRGTEALGISSRISPFIVGFSSIIQEFFGWEPNLSIYLTLIISILICSYFILFIINNFYNEINKPALNLTIVSAFIYIMIIYHSIEYKFLGFYPSGRFLFSIYPIVSITLTAMLYKFKNIYITLIISALCLFSSYTMLDFDFPYTDKTYSGILTLDSIIPGNNLIIFSYYKEGIQAICPQLAKANKVYIIPKYSDKLVFPDSYPESGHNYMFVFNRNPEIPVPYKKLAVSYLPLSNAPFEIYDMESKNK